MVTMKEIAELAGVSRGTVDRVLHGRGRASEETIANIKRIAAELGYERNPAARALSARRDQPLVAICLPSEGNPFFDDILRGMYEYADRYKIYGLKRELIKLKGYNPEDICAALEGLEKRARALLITPIDDECVARRIDELVEAGVFVVTVNNDVPSSKRQAFIGADFVNSGETACALIAAFLEGREVRAAILIGSRKVLGHRERVEGFKKRMEGLKDASLVAVIEGEDDDICSYSRTKKLLEVHPEITALFLAAGGVYGACRAVKEIRKEKRPLVIAVDAVPTTIRMMREGIVKAIIYQHPVHQGHLAVEMVFEHIVNGREVERPVRIMKNEIRLLENL